MISFPSKPRSAFADVPMRNGMIGAAQLSHRLNSIEDFEPVITLTENEKKALSQPGLFRVDITPYSPH